MPKLPSSSSENNLFCMEDAGQKNDDGNIQTIDSDGYDSLYYGNHNVEFYPGMTIPLTVREALTQEFEHCYQIDATIEQIFSPSTLSVVMRVSFDLAGCRKYAVLKLYDRRGAKGLRTANDICQDNWTIDFERDYQKWLHQNYDNQSILRNDLIQFMSENCDAGFYGAHEEYLGPYDPEFFREALFALACHGMKEHEVEVYEALSPLQGSTVPILYSQVIYTPPDSIFTTDEISSCFGLLLEYVEGIELDQMFDQIPATDHQRVGELAIDAVNQISSCGVLNGDVSTRNSIVRRKNSYLSSPGEYQVVIYDFGIARVREEYETEDAWLEIKWETMEVDKLGLELVQMANFEYDCIKPYAEDELLESSATLHMRQQQEWYKQQFFDSWRAKCALGIVA